MLIGDASDQTRLTKKAIEYYTEQGLIHPAILENGYRDYSRGDVERLRKIAVFRKLGLGIQDIRAALADETGEVLRRLAVKKALTAQRRQAERGILDKLCAGQSQAEIDAELEAVEGGFTIAERLLSAFPGYYGRFVCLHFARFLNDPITTAEQQQALCEIIGFLDSVPSMAFPEDVRIFFEEHAGSFDTETTGMMLETVKQSIENPEQFMSQNKEALERYIEYRQSDAYRQSTPGRVQALLKAFNSSSGYNDVFIPAMKRLSKPYADYFRQMEIANEKLLTQYRGRIDP